MLYKPEWGNGLPICAPLHVSQNKTPNKASDQKTFSLAQEKGSGYGGCQDSRLQEEQWSRCGEGRPAF